MMNAGTTLLDTAPALCCSRPGAEGFLAASLRANPDRFGANEEPCLNDLLADPIIARLMASDGLHRDHVCAMVRDVRARLGQGAVQEG